MKELIRCCGCKSTTFIPLNNIFSSLFFDVFLTLGLTSWKYAFWRRKFFSSPLTIAIESLRRKAVFEEVAYKGLSNCNLFASILLLYTKDCISYLHSDYYNLIHWSVVLSKTSYYFKIFLLKRHSHSPDSSEDPTEPVFGEVDRNE
jgi:hypothetical protein